MSLPPDPETARRLYELLEQEGLMKRLMHESIEVTPDQADQLTGMPDTRPDQVTLRLNQKRKTLPLPRSCL